MWGGGIVDFMRPVVVSCEYGNARSSAKKGGDFLTSSHEVLSSIRHASLVVRTERKCWKEVIVAYSRYDPSICLKRLTLI
jgi:hypothetical protein